jgi:hypothetical protein
MAAYWHDSQGVVRLVLQEDAVPQRVFEQRFIRDLQVTQVQEDVALAWVSRDRESDHRVRWRDEEQLVVSALAPRPFALGNSPDGPVVLYSHRDAGVTSLILWRWHGEASTVYEAEASIGGLSVAVSEDGTVYASWLEKPDQRDDWDAHYVSVTSDGRQDLIHLGPAVNRGLTDTTYLAVEGDTPVVMWPFETLESRARRSFGAQASGYWAVARIGDVTTVQQLAPLEATGIAFHDGYAYWANDSILYRQHVETPEAVAHPVVWSPGPIERGHVAGLDAVVHLLWYGPQQGGGYALYTADTRTAFQPGWRDEIARRMHWNPWRFWEALSVQALASLLIGIVATLLFVPLFWVSGVLMARARTSNNGALGGVGVGFLLLSGLLLLMIVIPSRMDWLAILPQFLVSAAIAAGVAWVLSRRIETELPMQVLSAAALMTSVTLSILTFLNFSYLGL